MVTFDDTENDKGEEEDASGEEWYFFHYFENDWDEEEDAMGERSCTLVSSETIE